MAQINFLKASAMQFLQGLISGEATARTQAITAEATARGQAIAEVAAGRVWHTTNADIAQLTPPATAQQISVTTNMGKLDLWRLAAAPTIVDPTIHFQSSGGTWWRLSEDTRSIKSRLGATAAATGDAGALPTVIETGSTGDAIRLALAQTMLDAGITAATAGSELKYSPDATNAAANPTVQFGGVNRGVRDADGLPWPAGGFVVGRRYRLRIVGGTFRVISGSVTLADVRNGDTANRTATADAVRDAGILPLASIAGTGDAITAALGASALAAGVTALGTASSIEYVPALPNAAENPTITIAGTTFGIRNADGLNWRAGGFVTGRAYRLRRFGSLLRVVAGDSSSSEASTERLNRIVADVQMGTVVLGAVAMVGDAITATVPAELAPAGIVAANLRQIQFAWPEATNTGPVTLNIDGQGALALRTAAGQPLPAGYGRPGRNYRFSKEGTIWRTIAGEVTATEQAALAASVDAVDRKLDPPALWRGDVAVVSAINSVPTIQVDPATGEAGLRLDAPSVAALAPRLAPLLGGGGGGGGGSASPAFPDVAGDIDAWNAWVDGQIVYFDAQLWGPHPRQYLRRAAGDVWTHAPARARLMLTYGSGMANAPTDRPAGHVYHVSTLNDAAGQNGLNGVVPEANATDIARAGPGIGATLADQWLNVKSGAKPWVGVRSEAVEGATLASLRTGQPMANLARVRQQFAAVLTPYRRTVQVDCVTVLHNGDLSNAAYDTALLALAQDIMAQTGAGSVVAFAPAGTSQVGGQAGVLAAPNVLNLRGTVPLILAAPVYWCEIRAGTLATPIPAHMTMLGELAARALLSPEYWHPPKAFRAVRSGAVIDIDFEVMSGRSLVAPTAGLTWSGAATIQSAAIVADPQTQRLTRLRVTLSAAQAGRIGYAVQPAGTDPARFAGRGDLRDDWGAASVTGQTLRSFALPFAYEV